jgi:hypothetical protein
VRVRVRVRVVLAPSPSPTPTPSGLREGLEDGAARVTTLAVLVGYLARGKGSVRGRGRGRGRRRGRVNVRVRVTIRLTLPVTLPLTLALPLALGDQDELVAGDRAIAAAEDELDGVEDARGVVALALGVG